MPKAAEVAADLRKLADSLDANPQAEIVKPWVFFSADKKDSFVSTARLLPRPFKKSIQYPNSDIAKILLVYETASVEVRCSVPQSLTCELVEPAKPAVYRCDPILSPEEDAALEAE